MVLVLLLMDSTQNLYFDFCEFINFLGPESNKKKQRFLRAGECFVAPKR